MRRLLSVIILSIPFFSYLHGQGNKTLTANNFEVIGNLPGLEGEKVRFLYDCGDSLRYDTARMTNGSFVLKGHINGPAYSELWTRDEVFSIHLYLEPGKMTISRKDVNSMYVVTGSHTEDEYAEFRKLDDTLRQIRVRIWDGLDELKQKDSVAAQKLKQERMTAYFEVRKEKETTFFKSHPKSMVSLWQLRILEPSLTPFEFQGVYNILDKSLQHSVMGKSMGQRLIGRLHTDIGMKAIDFHQKDVDGRDVTLSSFRGKYVLLDFWASWCMPCRKENPNVVAAYNKFKTKGFEILSVSLDTKADRWKDAIEKDQLTWTHVSDLKGWKNDVAEKYVINSVPFNFLIDPKGVIIAKNLRGEDLEKKLAELFPD